MSVLKMTKNEFYFEIELCYFFYDCSETHKTFDHGVSFIFCKHYRWNLRRLPGMRQKFITCQEIPQTTIKYPEIFQQ
ncbi:hypothetical protein MuYL_3592 [Mucilaginibacter xinganensis]|uniref:Uncharacterized protein n=1 Tax=Mucilaginibacter xinganensis TaxID=1234841 RepID=A0A223P045_9SPHI|nr:hypothetical protein MuYL_3592 [Mucilaginibacter xinganensis]